MKEEVLECDRCASESFQGETQARAAGWCESEDGEMVCPECWAKWDAEHALILPPEDAGAQKQ
jgi:hypothetical protein